MAEMNYGSQPQNVTCPHCGAEGNTKIVEEKADNDDCCDDVSVNSDDSNCPIHVFCSCLLCCCFAMQSCSSSTTTKHYCSSCGALLGSHTD